MAAARDKKVGGLDVAMNNSLRMRRVQRVRNFDGDIEQAVHFQRTAVDQVLQRRAVQKLHGDECFAILFANIVDGANARMIQRGRGLGFPLETSQSLRVARHFIGQEFQRDEAVQPGVFGFVNDAHASAAEAFHDAVVGDGLANQRGDVGHVTAILVCGWLQVNDSEEVLARVCSRKPSR